MRVLPLLVTALFTACERPLPIAHPTAPPTDVAAVAAPPEARGAPDAGESGDAPARDDVTADVAPADPPRARLLRDLAAGRATLADHTDPARGVLSVEYVEAGPGPGARAVRRARRLCGATLARDAELPRMLRDAVAQAEHLGLACDDDACTVAGMEYAPVWRVAFAGDAVVSVMRLSEAALGDDYLAARDAFVRRQVDAQRARRCPGGAR